MHEKYEENQDEIYEETSNNKKSFIEKKSLEYFYLSFRTKNLHLA